MALFGFRISQRSVLWPLIAVLLPAWVLLIWLLRNPSQDARVRLGYQQELSRRVSAGDQAALQNWLSKGQAAGLPTETANLPSDSVPSKARSWTQITEGVFLSLSVLAIIPAFWLLFRYPWPRFVWAERIQGLWSLPHVLMPLGLRGMATLAGRYVLSFLTVFIVGAIHRGDAQAAIQTHTITTMLLHAGLTLGLVWMVKEIIGGRSSKLHEILGYDQWDFLDWRLWTVAAGLGIPLGALATPLVGWLETLGLPGHPILDAISRSPAGFSGVAKVLFVLQMLLLAPFVEEMIYRGFLLSALRNWCGPVMAAIFSSGLFMLVHALSTPGMILVFVQGLVLCVVKLRTQRLALAMLTHFFMNLMHLL